MPADRRKLRAELARSRSTVEDDTSKNMKAASPADGDKSTLENVETTSPARASTPVKKDPVAKNLTIGDRKVRQGKLLSEGSFGRIYAGIDADTSEEVSIRKVLLQGTAAIDRTKMEIELFRTLFDEVIVHHPYIVHFYGAKISKKATVQGGGSAEEPSSWCIWLFELCKEGNLRTRLGERVAEAAPVNIGLPQQEVLNFLTGVAAALAYLSRSEITHYNVRSECVHTGKTDGLWKLGDLRTASTETYDLSVAQKKVLREAQTFLKERCTNKPPEVADLSLKWLIGPKVDSFALGCVLFEALTGAAPELPTGPGSGDDLRAWRVRFSAEVEAAYEPALLKWCRRLLMAWPRARPSAVELEGEVKHYQALQKEPPSVSEEALALALDQISTLTQARRYSELPQFIHVLDELVGHCDVETHKELLERKTQVFGDFHKQILEDFATLHLREHEWQAGLEDLAPCVDAMDPSVRSDVVRQYCEHVLEAYDAIFEPPKEASGLETWERRYPWLLRPLREYDSRISKYFRKEWRVEFTLSNLFCHHTRRHLFEVLEALEGGADPELMAQVLRKCIILESDLERKYPFSERLPKSSVGEAAAQEDDALVPRFHGIISGCFESYMGPWVQSEETQLIAMIDKSMSAGVEQQLRTDIDPDEDDEDHIVVLKFLSAYDLFTHMQAVMGKCGGFSALLADLFQAFQKVLRHYIERLSGLIPKSVTRPLDKSAILNVCCIMGTAEYCDEMAAQLEESFHQVIDPKYDGEITFNPEKDEFHQTVRSVNLTLVQSVDKSLDDVFRKMTRHNWRQYSDEVTTRSPYVDDISDKLHAQFEPLAKNLSSRHFKLFCDRFVRSFVSRFNSEIFQCRKISDQGARQLLLDTSFIKTTLLEVPLMCTGKPMQSAYATYVLREMDKIDAMLELLSAAGNDASPDGKEPTPTSEEIDRILALRADSPNTGMMPVAEWRAKMMGTFDGGVIQSFGKMSETVTEKGGNMSNNLKQVLQVDNIKLSAEKVKDRLRGFRFPGTRPAEGV